MSNFPSTISKEDDIKSTVTNEIQLDEIVQKLLQSSRQKLSSGKPSEALENVIEAIRMTQGEAAIMKILDAAKAKANHSNLTPPLQVLKQSIEEEQIINNLQQQSNSSLYSNLPLKTNNHSSNNDFNLEAAKKASQGLIEQSSILAEIGDGSEFILQDAFEDGSSIICTRCTGLVARERWTAHCAYWCPFSALETNHDDDDDDDNNNE